MSKTQVLFLRRSGEGRWEFCGSMEDPSEEDLSSARQAGLTILKLDSQYDHNPLPPITSVEDLSKP